MSDKFNEIKKDLKKINKLMDNIIDNWNELNDEDFYRLAKNYPKYLPSFDEFKSDFNEWVNSLLDDQEK